MKLPRGWRTGHVADLGRLVTGSTPSTSNEANFGGPIPFLTPGDLGGTAPITKTERTLSVVGAEQCRKLPRGSVLVVCIGSTIGKTGRAGCELATNQQINAVVPNSDTCGTFAFYEISRISKEFRRLAGAQAVPILSKSEFGDFPVTIPPLPEQRKIADILTTWDEALEKLDALIAAQERRKKALMQQLLTGKKRFPGFKGKWQNTRLGDVLEPISRPTAKPQRMFLAAGIRSHGKGVFIKPDFAPADIALEELFELRVGDLVVNITFAWEGAAAIVPPEADGALVSHRFPAFKFREGWAALSFFRHYILTKRFIFGCGLASPGGAGRNRVLSKSAFLDLELSLPPIDEQEKIGCVLDAASEALTHLRTQRTAIDQQKCGLMQKLLTGKIRVRGDTNS